MFEFRNPAFTADGRIDLEINHPIHGWAPCTVSADDPPTAELYAAAFAQGPAAYVAPPVVVTGADIDRERDRRVQAGVVVTLAGYGPVALQGRDMDQRNLHGLATAAQLRIAAGQGNVTSPFRDRDNVIHTLTQVQILDLWSQGAAFVTAVFQAAWALKDGPDPIPVDFTDDGYWP